MAVSDRIEKYSCLDVLGRIISLPVLFIFLFVEKKMIKSLLLFSFVKKTVYELLMSGRVVRIWHSEWFFMNFYI